LGEDCSTSYASPPPIPTTQDKTASFYGEDLGADTISEGVAGLVAGTLSGAQASNLLNKLLRNATNVQVYEVVDITSQALTANLPPDVVRIVPWAAVTNGPTGAVPQDFWQKIGAAATTLVNALLEVGQLLYDGLVAVGTFLVNVGEAIWNWGMRAAGEVQAAAQAAIQKVGEVLVELVNFVISQIEAFFASFYAALQALWDATAGAYLRGIEEAFGAAIAEFEITGAISPSTAARLVAALTAPLFWAFVGIAVAVVVGYVVYAVSTLGLGVLLASVGTTIAAALAWQVFGLAVVDFTIGILFDPGATIQELIGPFLSWFASVSWIDPSLESMWSMTLGAAFATGSTIANAVAYAASDQSGSMATVWGLVFGFLSLVFSFGTGVGGAIGQPFAVFSGFLGAVGAFFSFMGRVKSPLYHVVNLAAATMAFTGAYLGVTYALS
ncbi:MAG: hypothetical protein ACE5KY_05030, partial [Candidatus Tectimicrobiota bacterium]